LTWNLLDHPEIIATAEHLCDETEASSSSRQTSSSVASSLNYNNGLASMVMADILHQQIRKNQQENKLVLANLANHTLLTIKSFLWVLFSRHEKLCWVLMC
jgi:hypothetical protein